MREWESILDILGFDYLLKTQSLEPIVLLAILRAHGPPGIGVDCIPYSNGTVWQDHGKKFILAVLPHSSPPV